MNMNDIEKKMPDGEITDKDLEQVSGGGFFKNVYKSIKKLADTIRNLPDNDPAPPKPEENRTVGNILIPTETSGSVLFAPGSVPAAGEDKTGGE